MENLSDDQSAFINALKQLEDAAWGKLFDTFQNRLLKDITASMRRRGVDAQHAEDVASETWLVAVEKIAELECRDLETLYHWLRVISFNRVRNLSRRKQPDTSMQDVEDEQSEQGSFSMDAFLWTHHLVNASPEVEFDRAAQSAQLEAALQYLTPRERDIWLRRYLDGHNSGRIARDYAIKPHSVSQYLGRTRKKLRACLVNKDSIR